jgi:hypothetical protein
VSNHNIEQNGYISISTDTSRGATIRTAYVEREVRAYAIFENEVSTITMWNSLTAIFGSLGLASLTFAVGIWTAYSFADKLTPQGDIMAHVVAWGCCVAWLIFWAIAIFAFFSRRTVWRAIRAESKQPRS